MRIPVLVVMFICLISLAHAADVAYLLNNPAIDEPILIQELTEAGLSVQKISNANIPTTDFSQYKLILIPDQVFSNAHLIPVNQMPALILNRPHMDDWHWVAANKLSSKSSSAPLTAHINNNTHYITNGFPADITVYTSSTPSYAYLHRYYRASALKSIVAPDGSSSLNMLNAVVATAQNGTVLKDGYISNTKSVFFGVTNSQYWTEDTKQLYKNAAKWLATDFVAPTISNIQVNAITNSSATLTWNTNKLTNYTFSYGTTPALGNSLVNKSLSVSHKLDLKNLQEKTRYYYKIKACNSDAICQETGLGNFTTLDLTAPYLTSTSVSSITNVSAMVSASWTEIGNARLWFGKNSLDQQTGFSATGTNAGSSLTDLEDKTTYSYLLEMCDLFNNCRNSSTLNFTTLDITAPKAPGNVQIAVENPGNRIKLSWNAPADDASLYDIYFSDTPDGFDFSEPNETVTTNFFIDGNAATVKNRYYIVRSEDGHGNEESNSLVLGKFDLSLKKGYNLISFSIDPISTNIANVMHQNASYKPISEVKSFDASLQQFIDSSFIANSWNKTIQLESGKGYFFKADSETVFTIVGTPVSAKNVAMEEGMNLFGLVSLENKQLSSVISQTPLELNVTEVGKRNENGQYSLSTYTTDWSDDFALQPGIGYWAKATKDFSLEVSP